MTPWPITFQDVLAARRRIRPYLPPTALRRYAALEAAVGRGIQIAVKHENHNPTNSFKVRNGLSVLTALDAEVMRRGVIAATRGNHGAGIAWAGQRFGVPVTICVPAGNNPEKNEAMRGLGATLVEEGRDYDESVAVADRLVAERGLRMIHSSNDPLVIAGAATYTLEILEELNALDALVIAVGGGGQAVGAMTVVRELKPGVEVYGVQAERAPAIHDSWHAGEAVMGRGTDTFADGLATRGVYEGTFGALREGLKGFITVSEAEIAEALRLLLSTTHNLVEGAGAAGLAGLVKLRDRLAGKTVAVVLSGGNIDAATLRRVVDREI
jgi:threonine dehydratase